MHVHAYAGISPACRSALPLACACTRAQGRGLSPACLSQKFPTSRGRRPSLSLRSGLSPARAASHWLSLASRASAPACKKRAAVRRRVHSCTCDATRRPARRVGGEVLGTAGFAQSGHHPVAAPAQPAVPSPRHGTRHRRRSRSRSASGPRPSAPRKHEPQRSFGIVWSTTGITTSYISLFTSRGKIRVLSELELENGSPSPLHPRPFVWHSPWQPLLRPSEILTGPP